MSQETVELTPALTASQSSWRCVHAHDKEGWLALMADDILVEDPIGVAFTNPDGAGMHGKAAMSDFYDANVGPNQLTITCEQTWPSSSPAEVAHLLTLRTEFGNGTAATVRGVFTYRVDDRGLLTNLRGYWNADSITFEQ